MKKILFWILLLLILNGVVSAAPEGKYVIITTDQLTLQEIADYAGDDLIQLFDDSAQGLINVRTDQGISPQATHRAFGSGSRGENYDGIPGMLGELLKKHSLKIAAYGNSDYGNEERREIVSIVMDNNGKFDYGNVDRSILQTDSNFPGGWRTDYELMSELFINNYHKFAVIVLEIGDFARIKTAREYGEINLFEQENLLRKTFEQIDQLLQIVIENLDFNQDRLMIVSPTPDLEQVAQGNKLSWLLIKGKDVEAGVLTTGTTRRPGLTTISDIAPTILDFYQITIPPVISGRKIYATETEHGGIGALITLNQQIVRTSIWRSWFIRQFIFLQIILLTLALLTFFSRKIAPLISRRLINLLCFMFLMVLMIPLVFLLYSPYLFAEFVLYLILFILFLIISSLLIRYFIKDPFLQITSLIIITVLLILIDIFLKTPWMSRSLLGYCSIIGARFYGIGNEYMGIVVGGTLLGWNGLLDKFNWLKEKKMILSAIIYITVMIIIALPFLGANFGGSLTAAAAFAFSYLLSFPRDRRFKAIIQASIVIIVLLGIIIISDTLGLIGERSHIGRTIYLLKDQGIFALLNILTRKLSMNLKLLRWTIWTKVLLSFIVVLVLLFKKPKGYFEDLIREFPEFRNGFLGAVFGSIITMMVNDSGVVAAATLLFFPVHSLIYLILKKTSINRYPQKNF